MTDQPDNAITPRGTLIAFALVVLAISAGAVLIFISQPEPVQITINPPQPTATPNPTEPPAPIMVYVTGAVASPLQTVRLPVGSRVQEALDAAGGLLDTADQTRINPAQLLRDGDQIHVPAINEEVILATPSGGGIVAVNYATLEELMTLPGVGPALAQRIIDYRAENGPFADLEALDAVSGIGPALLEGIAELVAFD